MDTILSLSNEVPDVKVDPILQVPVQEHSMSSKQRLGGQGILDTLLFML